MSSTQRIKVREMFSEPVYQNDAARLAPGTEEQSKFEVNEVFIGDTFTGIDIIQDEDLVSVETTEEARAIVEALTRRFKL